VSDITAPRPMVPAFTGIYDAFEPLALPLLRFVMGIILVPHGCQKLFGWFGGMGFEKFTELFDKMGWHPAVFWLSLVACTEFFGGLMLAFGFLTRFAAAAIFIFMLNAMCATGNRGGFFWNQGGLEYSLLIGVVALVFLVRGGGKYSIDRAIGWEL
jgi:putative oxidoreductase